MGEGAAHCRGGRAEGRYLNSPADRFHGDVAPSRSGEALRLGADLVCRAGDCDIAGDGMLAHCRAVTRAIDIDVPYGSRKVDVISATA